MNFAEIQRWCLAEYPEYTEPEISQFTGECIAMNLDPRMRPRSVFPKRREDGKVYAHRVTRWMEDTVEEILRRTKKRATWGREAVYVVGMSDDHSRHCLKYGLNVFGDIAAEIELTIDSSAEFYDEVTRRVSEQVALMGGKVTMKERLALREEVIGVMGGQPEPRKVQGIGLLPIAVDHEPPAIGRRRMTRIERATLLARRDAIDQVFPALGNVQHTGEPT